MIRKRAPVALEQVVLSAVQEALEDILEVGPPQPDFSLQRVRVLLSLAVLRRLRGKTGNGEPIRKTAYKCDMYGRVGVVKRVLANPHEFIKSISELIMEEFEVLPPSVKGVRYVRRQISEGRREDPVGLGTDGGDGGDSESHDLRSDEVPGGLVEGYPQLQLPSILSDDAAPSCMEEG